MAEIIQIERAAPQLRICPICKAPTHLGCDHAVIEFQAEQKEKERQRKKAERQKTNENKTRVLDASVEKTREFDDIADELEMLCNLEDAPSWPEVFDLCSRAAAEIRRLRGILGET